MALKWLSNETIITERKTGELYKNKQKTFFFLKDSILIYGATLESYCCINALLADGIPSNSIKLIYPPDHQNVRPKHFPIFSTNSHLQANIFNDPTVLKTLQEQLEELNIEIYEKLSYG